jgi:membrane protein YqaA with SNARE-associated domain
MLFDNVVEAVLGFVTNPVFVKYGLIGLFLNGVLSWVTPLPTEATTSALILSGHDLNVIFLVLAISSTIGGYLAYYIRYGRKGFLGRIP